MPLLLVLVFLLGILWVIHLAAYYLARELLAPCEIVCLHCQFRGHLGPRRLSLLRVIALLAGLLPSAGRTCPACGSEHVQEIVLSEGDYLRDHFSRLSDEELKRIVEAKPDALTPVGLRFAREEQEKRKRRS